MGSVRPAAVAGSFYPGSRRTLESALDGMLAEASPKPGRPKALVVPHAGYVYSGPIAASAYVQLRPPFPTRVLLLGPAHYEALEGMALPGAGALATPLGEVPVDGEAVEALRGLPGVVERASVHAREHSLEVQLPFLQRILPAFAVVPLAVGHVHLEDVARVIETLWGGAETLVLISTDLSHYLPCATAREVDAETARAILHRDPSIAHGQACGAGGLRGLLEVARRKELRVELLDLRNSADTAGDPSRVVGYGAFGFYEGTGP